MNELLQQLMQQGYDVDNALARFVGDEGLYLRCLRKFKQDDHFLALGEAIAQGDTTLAFEQAHALKGVAANLGATPLLMRIETLVEPLRRGEVAGMPEAYEQMMQAYRTFCEQVGE